MEVGDEGVEGDTLVSGAVTVSEGLNDDSSCSVSTGSWGAAGMAVGVGAASTGA